MSIFAEEETLPISAAQAETLERTFKQEPVSLRLPISLPTTKREIIIVAQPDYTPLVLGVISFLTFLGFLAYLVSRK